MADGQTKSINSCAGISFGHIRQLRTERESSVVICKDFLQLASVQSIKQVAMSSYTSRKKDSLKWRRLVQ